MPVETYEIVELPRREVLRFMGYRGQEITPEIDARIDEGIARTSGTRTGLVNVGFAIAVSIVIAVSARTIGALIVSSMLVIPVVCALQSEATRTAPSTVLVFIMAYYTIKSPASASEGKLGKLGVLAQFRSACWRSRARQSCGDASVHFHF